VCQFISALLASTGFYYLASIYINANLFAVGSFVFVASVGLELSFNTLNKTIAKQKYDDKTEVSSILKGLIVFFGLIYAGSTFWGTPYAVEFLAASPDYNSIEQISIEHDVLIKSDSSFWGSRLSDSRNNIASFVTAHSKFDSKIDTIRLRSDAVNPHKEMEADYKILKDKALASALPLIRAKEEAIKKAEKENEIMKVEHFAWCSSFGWGLSFVSILCIFIFLPAFHWCQKYERDELKDNDSILNKLEEAKKKEEAQERFEIEKLKALAPKVGDKDKEEELTKVLVNEPSTPMGFATAKIKEGDILKGEGRKNDRVYVMVKDELRAMTKGEVNTLKKGQSTPERIKHLEMLRNKLN